MLRSLIMFLFSCLTVSVALFSIAYHYACVYACLSISVCIFDDFTLKRRSVCVWNNTHGIRIHFNANILFFSFHIFAVGNRQQPQSKTESFVYRDVPFICGILTSVSTKQCAHFLILFVKKNKSLNFSFFHSHLYWILNETCAQHYTQIHQM